MLLMEESQDDELNSSKLSLLDRTISIDSQSVSSESSNEEPISLIKTNLNEAQLALFRSYDEDSKSKLSICTDENTIWIEFPGKYPNASISLFQPDCDEKHDSLKLVPVNDNYLIHNGEIVFKVNQEISKELKLDFFGIQFTNDNAKKNDIDDAYKRNTARLFIKNYDNNEKLVTSYKSQIIRNKNFEVSEDISILQIKQDKKDPTKYLLRLDHNVPYFPSEIEIEIKGFNKKFIPTTERGFPIREFIINVRGEIKCTLSNTRILCRIFRKESIPKKTQLNVVIENRKKKNKQNIEISETSETNSCTLIPESKKTKEICLVINQIEFDNEDLESRKSHSKHEIDEIKKVFSETLNYDVHIITDSTTQELKNKIANKLDNFDDNHDNIVVFVFSHGDNNMFHTRDGSIKYDEFVKLFFPIHRQQIYDKPKIFFISCCQGKNVNTLNKSLIPKGIIEMPSASNEHFFKIKDLPKYSNVFMGFSSVSDYYSLRVNSETPFIQNLLAVIRENPALPVTEIQNRTQRREDWRTSLTISCVYHSLTKEVYFKRKENN